MATQSRYGGAGTLVPITGFANAVASPAIDFKTEGMVTGMAAKILAGYTFRLQGVLHRRGFLPRLPRLPPLFCLWQPYNRCT